MQHLYEIVTRDVETGEAEDGYEVAGHDAVFADVRNLILDDASWTPDQMEEGMSELRRLMPIIDSLEAPGHVEIRMPETFAGDEWKFEVRRVD